MSSRVDRIGIGLGFGAFLLFAGTTSRFAFPDESAALLARHLHLTPFGSLTHPLWSWIAQGLAALRMGPAAFLPNVFSALCGAGCVWLVFQLVRRMGFVPSHERLAPATRTLAGGAAALYLMVAIPFWMASNRAHYASLDLLLLLGAVELMWRFRERGHRGLVYLIPATLVLGAVESPTMAAVLPAFGVYYLLLLRARRPAGGVSMARMAAAVLPGLCVFLLFVWQYYRSPAAEWREFPNYGRALLYALQEQWALLRGSVPRHGWLMLVFSGFLPWAICVWMPRDSREFAQRTGMRALMAVISGLAVAILFNARYAPWRLTGASPLLVTPYVFIAAYFGYSVGYWYSASAALADRNEPVPASLPRLILALFLVLLLIGGWRNYPSIQRRGAAACNRLAAAMAGHMGGRAVLVTDGLCDDLLLLAARDRRMEMNVVNSRMTSRLPYRRYAASLATLPRLRALARAGFLPFLTQWLKTDPRVAERVAFQSSPDAWLNAGYGLLPDRSLYRGFRGDDETDVDALVAGHRAFWKQAETELTQMKSGAPPLRRIAELLGRHLSRVANDAGVYLENRERFADAVEAYRAAIALGPRNLSAALNLRETLLATGETEEAQRAEAEGERMALEQKMPLKALVDSCGHVRTKAALDRLREMWNRSSRTSAPDSPGWTEALEAANRGEADDARRKLEKILRDDPDFDPAWVLLARLAQEAGDHATLQRVVQRMRADGKEWPQVLVIVGEEAMKRKDLVGARKYLERAARLWPDDTATLEKLVRMDLARNRADTPPAHLDALLTLDPRNAIGNFALGSLLAEAGDHDLAETAFRAAIERERYPPALNNLAWLLQAQGRLDEALSFAREATQSDPTSYNAWDTLGVVHMKRGALEDAESVLRMAQTLRPDAVEVQVHLVEVLSRRGDAAGARAIAVRLLKGSSSLSADVRSRLRVLAK